MPRLHVLEPGSDFRPSMDGIQLVRHEQCGRTFPEQGQHLGVAQREAARLDHKQHQIDAIDGA